MPDTPRQPTYEPPVFEILGTMASLTQAGSGAFKDKKSGMQINPPS